MKPSLLLSFTLVLISCASSHGIANQGATVVSSASVHLRNTFDTDPSTYIGRFVPAGVTDLDESNTMVLACSKHIKARFIDGGGVAFAEDLDVSTQVAARLGIPVIADASASHKSSRTARADYVLTGKLVAEIDDPEAFAACCKSQPDQCTDRFIGEFIQGTGTLKHQAERTTTLDASGTNPQTGVSGAGGFDRGASWTRVAEFNNPVYFAFKIHPTAYVQGAVDTCPSWVDRVPKAEGGVYVVGRADGERSEEKARNDALRDINSMALKAAGLAPGSLGGAPIPTRVEEWCVTQKPVRRSVRYSARVLAFVSDESIAEAKQRAAELQAQWREEQRLAAERQAAEREAARRDAATTTPPPADPSTPTAPETPAAGSSDLSRIVAAVEAESFSADKIAALKSSAGSASLTAAEVRRVLDLFSFSGDKLEAVTFLRDKVSDPQNWHLIVDAFTSSSDRDKVRGLAP